MILERYLRRNEMSRSRSSFYELKIQNQIQQLRVHKGPEPKLVAAASTM